MSQKPMNVKEEWIILGSGPSAPEYLPLVLTPERKVACVNGSVGLLPKGRFPDTYAVFEGAAMGKYGSLYKEMQESGVTLVARRIVSKIAGFKPDVEIDVGWGSESGYDKERVTERLSGAMVSGGVELLHAIAHRLRPPVIHAVGFDGYEPAKLHADAAGSVEPRSAQWCNHANAGMTAHIAAITQAYPKVQFIFYGKPCHATPDWRCNFVEGATHGKAAS